MRQQEMRTADWKGALCVAETGKKSFSRRRKDRREGREAALQGQRKVGCDEPPKGHMDRGGAEPQQEENAGEANPKISFFSDGFFAAFGPSFASLRETLLTSTDLAPLIRAYANRRRR